MKENEVNEMRESVGALIAAATALQQWIGDASHANRGDFKEARTQVGLPECTYMLAGRFAIIDNMSPLKPQ